MTTREGFLIGLISGLVIGGSWGLGHASGWNSPGPVAGIVVAFLVLAIVFIAMEGFSK